ncbi:MAG: ribosome silencing factor [Acidimicrobiia bacterium]
MTAPAPDASRRAVLAARTADQKLGSEIAVLDVGDIISITERFVLVSAANTRQVRTIVDEIEAAMKLEEGDGPRAVEGLDDASWVLMDFGDVIVHVFLVETRAYYDLDGLWSDAPVEDWLTETDRAAQSR